MRFADLDAVTIDGFGTLLTLADPVPALDAALRRRGIERPRDDVAAAFAREGAYYRAHSHLGRDAESLAALRRAAVAVFLDRLDNPLTPDGFVDDFMGAMRFKPVPGALETVERLRAAGVPLAVVANWDVSLHEHVDELGLRGLFDAVITSAEAPAPKPDPRIFLLALERLGAAPRRSLHVGDEPKDEHGARAAGMRFLSAPLVTAFDGWT